MSDLDAVLTNLKRGNIGKASAIMDEFAGSHAARVVKGCVVDGRRSRVAKIAATNERVARQCVELRRARDERLSVQARLEFLESPALPTWLQRN